MLFLRRNKNIFSQFLAKVIVVLVVAFLARLHLVLRLGVPNVAAAHFIGACIVAAAVALGYSLDVSAVVAVLNLD